MRFSYPLAPALATRIERRAPVTAQVYAAGPTVPMGGSMAQDLVADRLRTALAGEPITEQMMFGGTCFMLGGDMLAGSHKSELLIRVGKEAHAAALARPHSR